MPKKIEIDFPPSLMDDLILALEDARKQLHEKSDQIWQRYSNSPDFIVRNPPPESSELSNSRDLIGALLVSLRKEKNMNIRGTKRRGENTKA